MSHARGATWWGSRRPSPGPSYPRATAGPRARGTDAACPEAGSPGTADRRWLHAEPIAVASSAGSSDCSLALAGSLVHRASARERPEGAGRGRYQCTRLLLVPCAANKACPAYSNGFRNVPDTIRILRCTRLPLSPKSGNTGQTSTSPRRVTSGAGALTLQRMLISREDVMTARWGGAAVMGDRVDA